MIFTGYVLIILYILFLIFVVGNKIKNFFNVETSRKIIHVGLFFVWILIDIFLKNTIHQVIIPIIPCSLFLCAGKTADYGLQPLRKARTAGGDCRPHGLR